MRKRFLVPHKGECYPSRVFQYDHQKVWTICSIKGAICYIKLRKSGVI